MRTSKRFGSTSTPSNQPRWLEWCNISIYLSPNVLVVPSLHAFFSNHTQHTCEKPCRRPSMSSKMGPMAMGCGNCPQATRPHVHKLWCMYVFPNVLVVPSSHGLSPNHPHPTCAKLCRRPSKSYKMGAEAEACEKCPLATRPHVHKMCVSPNVLVVPSLHAFFSKHTHHTCARPCRRPSMS
jgi:hypothetical protein